MSRHSDLVNHDPKRRQRAASLARPAHARERSAGAVATVLDCSSLVEEISVRMLLGMVLVVLVR